MTQAQTDKNAAELAAALAAIGIPEYLVPHLRWPVFEDNYMKFMSDGGRHDAHACDAFEEWLKSRGFSYERHRDRAIRQIDPRAVTLISELWGCEDDDAPMPNPRQPHTPLPPVPATPSGAGLPPGYVLSQDEHFDWWLAKLSGAPFPGGPRLIGPVVSRERALEVALFTIDAHALA